MRLDKVEVGSWYRTKHGIGKALDKTRFRGVVKFSITYPFPRGLTMVAPRDIVESVEAPVEGAATPPQSWL